MLHILRSFTLFLAFAVAAPANPVAVDKDDAFRPLLKDWAFGDTLSGERVMENKLAGKAVVIHHWVLGSDKCEALLARLAELEKANRERGLVIIGTVGVVGEEKPKATDREAIKALLEKHKVEYTITDAATGPVEVVGAPRAFVFDAEGETLYDGNPDDPLFNEAVKEAIASVKIPAGGANRPSLLNERPRNLIESRTWKNAEGIEITAAIKSADDKTVTFLLPNGQQSVYPLEKLSPESRDVINAARAATGKGK
jgi:hypothetical protein